MRQFRDSVAQSRNTAPRLGGLMALLVLGACASSLTGPRTEAAPDSLTVQRIQGRAQEVLPLLPAAGNVWPDAELDTQRATLGSPDLMERPSPDYAPPPRGGPRGSSTSPDLLQLDQTFQPAITQPQPSRAPDGLPSTYTGTPGRVIPTPEGSVVTTGGGRGYSTYTGPNGRTGTAIQQGATTILMDADGTVRQVPTPR